MLVDMYRLYYLTLLHSRVVVYYGYWNAVRTCGAEIKINSVLATIYFISAPSVRTCRAEIK